MPDSEAFAASDSRSDREPKSSGPAPPASDKDDSGKANSSPAFGFRLYPTLNSPPIPLWASSWEERELWKTAMTEGISLLAQKERVLRRDIRKRRRVAEHADRERGQKGAERRLRSTTEDQYYVHGSSGGLQGLVNFGKEILGYNQPASDVDGGVTAQSKSPVTMRQRSFSQGDAACSEAALIAASTALSRSMKDPADRVSTKANAARKTTTAGTGTVVSRRRRSNSSIVSTVAPGESVAAQGDHGHRTLESQRQELRRRRRRSGQRINVDTLRSDSVPSDLAEDDRGAPTGQRHRRTTGSHVDSSPTRGVRSYATLTSAPNSKEEKTQTVTSLAAELKASILTRFSSESRGSSVGFNLNDTADRVCVRYLRSLQPMATEHQNISNVLHPLLEYQVLKLRNRSRHAGGLPTGATPTRNKVTTISAKERACSTSLSKNTTESAR